MTKFKKGQKNLILLGIVLAFVFIIAIIFWPSGKYQQPGGLGNTCMAKPKYFCQNSLYNHLNYNIIVTLGQTTGTNWSTANFVFVPKDTAFKNNIPNISFVSYPANTSYSLIGLKSGNVVQLSLPVSGITPPIKLGTQAIGTIWAQYTTVQNGTPQYADIASINIKAS